MDAAEDCTGKQRSDKKRDAGFYANGSAAHVSGTQAIWLPQDLLRFRRINECAFVSVSGMRWPGSVVILVTT
jgi:hypothetical protein